MTEMIRWWSVWVILFVMFGCRDGQRISKIQQGVVEYSIDYPENFKSRSVSHILPDKLQVYFADDRMKLVIKGDMNLFSLDFLSLAGGDSCFTVFRLLNRRMLYPLKTDERWFLFGQGAPYQTLIYRDSIASIAGFKCYKVAVSRSDNPKVRYDAWFTDQLVLNSKMMRSPFEGIDGVPMAFIINYNRHEFRFRATSFSCDVQTEPIALPTQYELVSRQEVRDMVDMIIK
ncbi:MAG: hypothetical protein JXR39_08225 [Marinilabiliaceae bacterium]|nr:hypothetical protein [Marinilabiliaceae bacterium]